MGNLCPTVTCLGTLYSADCTVKGYYVPVPVRRVIQLSGVAVYVRGVSGAWDPWQLRDPRQVSIIDDNWYVNKNLHRNSYELMRLDRWSLVMSHEKSMKMRIMKSDSDIMSLHSPDLPRALLLQAEFAMLHAGRCRSCTAVRPYLIKLLRKYNSSMYSCSV